MRAGQPERAALDGLMGLPLLREASPGMDWSPGLGCSPRTLLRRGHRCPRKSAMERSAPSAPAYRSPARRCPAEPEGWKIGCPMTNCALTPDQPSDPRPAL